MSTFFTECPINYRFSDGDGLIHIFQSSDPFNLQGVRARGGLHLAEKISENFLAHFP